MRRTFIKLAVSLAKNKKAWRQEFFDANSQDGGCDRTFCHGKEWPQKRLHTANSTGMKKCPRDMDFDTEAEQTAALSTIALVKGNRNQRGVPRDSFEFRLSK